MKSDLKNRDRDSIVLFYKRIGFLCIFLSNPLFLHPSINALNLPNEPKPNQSIQNPFDKNTNYAWLDWSNAATAQFSHNNSNMTISEKSHSKLVRIITDQKEYAMGENLNILVRVDEPIGKQVMTVFAELEWKAKHLASPMPSTFEGPFKFPETPGTAYYRMTVSSGVDQRFVPGTWALKFNRVFKRFAPEDFPKREPSQLECYTIPVKMKRQTTKAK